MAEGSYVVALIILSLPIDDATRSNDCQLAACNRNPHDPLFSDSSWPFMHVKSCC